MSGDHADQGERNPWVLIATMCMVALTVAVLQTGVVPVLGVMARQLHVSSVDVSWAVTANLLAAAASTPLLGRLADLNVKKRVLLAVLFIVLAGSVLGAMTSSLPLLIAARVLQGASFALYPIGISILREELPADRLMTAMAVLSAVLGFGGGVGLVITGLLMRGDASYHRVFWFTAAFLLAVIAAVLALVPRRPASVSGTVDWVGAAGLAGGLSPLLLAITQGNVWGWTDPRTVGAAILGAVVLVLWWWWEGRCTQPLVSIGMLTRRPLLLTNVATVAVGMGLYFGFLGLTGFVQAPTETGYGFGASVLEASAVYLFPGALAGFATALISGRYIDRYGARTVMLIGTVTGIPGFAMLAAAHSTTAQMIAGIILVNVYISLAYGALPALVIGEVEPGETGVATSINAIARTVGGSLAAALAAVLLSHRGPGGFPLEQSYTVIFGLGALTAAIAVLLIVASRPRLRDLDTIDDLTKSRAMNREWG
jgi:MFS family permease